MSIHDCAMGLEIHSTSGTPNELDVAFLWNNRLHLIECKTSLTSALFLRAWED
ncbi:hypothetical protein DESUT3_02930 [Desulfuromonas versatilis]|uniref:Card1 endonuclease domain-containing protein n=1 Tax=Desulfuromonas versatilis TaxID=2802975 RepID=A0ABN6DTJ5_9BACT|nr:DUF1887 family CARF protein [Desulfuromonas versatilis]BCR03224.1 hypothetical protein DESUT3_02930 [Desulfuromonas versatilis]